MKGQGKRKSSKALRGKPKPAPDVSAEQAREAQEAEAARNAEASIRDRMVDIGRGGQQAGRQGS
jgi:hypothetical protein